MRVAYIMVMMLATVMSLKLDCQCPCPCQPDGKKLKNLINCFATWEKDAATNANSNLEGCTEEKITFCKTTNNKFCKFDGTNNLQETNEKPACYYNCGMISCHSWLVANKPEQVACIAAVFNEN